jgi:hypothetical protein
LGFIVGGCWLDLCPLGRSAAALDRAIRQQTPVGHAGQDFVRVRAIICREQPCQSGETVVRIRIYTISPCSPRSARATTYHPGRPNPLTKLPESLREDLDQPLPPDRHQGFWTRSVVHQRKFRYRHAITSDWHSLRAQSCKPVCNDLDLQFSQREPASAGIPMKIVEYVAAFYEKREPARAEFTSVEQMLALPWVARHGVNSLFHRQRRHADHGISRPGQTLTQGGRAYL